MLRSASTPLFGSLLSSFAEGPIHGGSPFSDFPQPSITKIHYRSNFQPESITMKLSSGSTTPDNSSTALRRAQSEGNLEPLNLCNDDAHPLATTSKKVQNKKCLKLETILSFSCTGKDREDDESEEEERAREVTSFFSPVTLAISKGEMKILQSAVDGGKTIVVDGGMSSGFGGRGGGWNDDSMPRFHSGDGEEINQTEENYRRMLDKDPSNSLILRNYAEFLHQSKGDPIGAESYCSRAILADPTDGDSLSLYAQLSWRLYRDEDKAVDYFDRAAKASPNDSHVHAAYARFLWELDEEDDCEMNTTPSHLQTVNSS